jgi:hypothetical protein
MRNGNPLGSVVVALGKDLLRRNSIVRSIHTSSIGRLPTSTISFLGNINPGMSEVEQAIKYP